MGSTGALPAGRAICFTGGALQYSPSNALDYSTDFLNSSSPISIDTNGRNVTFAGAIAASNNGGLTKMGSGILTLSAANNYSGLTTVAGGVLSITTTAPLPGWNSSGSYSVASGAALAVGNAVTDADIAAMLGTGNFSAGASIGFDTTADSRVYAVNLADSASPNGTLGLTKVGANTLTLSGNNSYSGTTTISGGTLSLASASALPGGTISFAGGTLQYSSANMVDYSGDFANSSGPIAIDTNGQTVTFAGAIAASNSGGLTKIGAGLLTLTGSNAYSGNTTISGGTLSIGNGGSGENLASTSISDSGALVFNHSDALTYGGVISGNGSLAKSGTGMLTLSGTGSFTGGTTIGGGILGLASSIALPAGGPIRFAGGTLQYSPSNTVDFSSDFANSSGPMAIDTNGQNVTFAGAIAASNNGGLTKKGAGILTLLGTDSYTGGTTIAAGVLSISSTAALPGWAWSGTYSVASGAALAVGDAVTDGNVAMMLGTGNFAAGSGLGFDTTAGNRTYAVNLANPASGALGLVKIGANALTLSGSNGYTGGTTISGGTLALSGSGTLGAPSGVLALSGGMLDLGGGSQSVGAVSVTAAPASGNTIQNGTLRGAS